MPRKDDEAEGFPLCRHLLWASESRGGQPSGKGMQRWEEEEAEVTLGQQDGKGVETDPFSKNAPAPTIF